ncbi:hypothetical protein C7S18_03375 [Ahniella affigens]|uniref:Tetratricopeptide repeat protein n=1 Tax=Ahniella affigens TaxID=2021234 RepID=A0A2P1PN60_9GAMM|nr:hypothetical protein [Ahniella affigens]AVP96286.1 hypothetical protein C7S18_03375 [Ahniella affigens]
MKEFVYEAIDAAGQKRQGSIVATTIADARFQLTRMGFRQARILSSELEFSKIPELDLKDEATAKIYVQSQRDSLSMVLIRIALGNWLIWLPFLLCSVWSLVEGPPFSLSDYAAFGLLALSVWVVVKLMMPSALYNVVLERRIQSDYQGALTISGIALRLVGGNAFMRKAFTQERAKALAGLGRTAEAEATLVSIQNELTDDEFRVARTGMADAARNYGEYLRLAEANYRHRPDNSEMALDYATALLHHDRQVETARQIASAFHPSALNELSRAGLNNVFALIAWHEQQWQLVVDKIQLVEAALQPFKSNPMARGYLFRCLCYKASALRQLGRQGEAEAIWQQIAPVLNRNDPELWQRIYDRRAD